MTSKRILIIDDEQIVLDSCTRILKGSDYELKTARNGTLGLELVREYQPDLIFVDLKMPGISGMEVLESVSEIDPTLVAIVITGFATVSSAVEAMKRGAYDFLPKPFTPDEFRLITKRGLEKRSLVLETIALRREKEALREHFAAIVSHELKSPLGAVQQNLFVLERTLADKLDEDDAHRLVRMKAKIDDLMKLIHTWLRVVSVDISEIQESFEPTSVADVVTKALENVEPQAVRKDIELRSEVADDAGQVLGDEVTLVEGLVNIAGNAVRYTHVGGHVTIAAKRSDDEVVISIADSGVGIAREDLPFVFRDFYRGRTGEETAKGSGIGLGITRRIIEAHHGAISVESELGKGSTFVVRLPALGTGKDGETNQQPRAAAEPRHGGKE